MVEIEENKKREGEGRSWCGWGESVRVQKDPESVPWMFP
jgi:hypothetical protein